MRILHLVPNMNFGGLQKVVRLLAIHQQQAGHSVTVCCWTNASNNPAAERELEVAGVRLIYPRRTADGGLHHDKLSSFRQLEQRLGPGRADILHVHNPFGYYIYGALAALAAGGTKVVNTIHLTAMFDHPNFGSRHRVKFRLAAILTDKIVSVCEHDDEFLRTRFSLPKRKRCVIHNGIDLAPFVAVPPRVAGDEIVFGFAGRMAPEKNHRVLIEAFALARRRHSNIRLRLLGSGPLEADLKAQVQHLHLEEVVEFHGFSNDVPAFLAGLDVYVLPSDFEAMPLSLLEAIASGLPVVATKVGGVPQVVHNTDSGWLCEPGNPKSIVAAMEVAIADRDRQQRAELARQLVAKNYSVERMVHDYERLYAELLKSPGSLSTVRATATP